MNVNYTTIAKCRKALQDVLAHRREDKDGNYVLWIGETTFWLCQDALADLESAITDPSPLPAKK